MKLLSGNYQVDNRDVTYETKAQWKVLRDEICSTLERDAFNKAVPLFVDLPPLLDSKYYGELLEYIRNCLVENKKLLPKARHTFTFVHLVEYISGLAKLRPYVKAFLVKRGVPATDLEWPDFGAFIDYVLHNIGVEVETIEEELNFLAQNISEALIRAVSRLASKKFSEENETVQKGVQAVYGCMKLTRRAAGAGATVTESVSFQIKNKDFVIKYNPINLVTTINVFLNIPRLVPRNTI